MTKIVLSTTGLLLVALAPCVCGGIQIQINGGASISPDNYKWFTAIEDSGTYICSAAFVGPVHVMTSTHCVQFRPRETLRAVVSYFCPQDDNCNRRSRQVKEISKIEFAPENGQLAILILDSPVTLGVPFAIPDVLAPPESSFLSFVSKNDPMTLVGGGKAGTDKGISDTARKLILSFQRRRWCKKRILKENRKLFTKRTICSRGFDGQPCRGDSGGAVIRKHGDRDIVLGIHTLGPADCSTTERSPLGHFAVNSVSEFVLDVVCNNTEFPSIQWCPGKVNPSQTPPPSAAQTSPPSHELTRHPTRDPTDNSTRDPTRNPTQDPTRNPTRDPTRNPTRDPTRSPTQSPTRNPTRDPTRNPTHNPTRNPTSNPTRNPTSNPTQNPTSNPTQHPTRNPTRNPTQNPTRFPTRKPTHNPTRKPTSNPTRKPTSNPTPDPTKFASFNNPPSSCTPSKTTYFYAEDTVLNESKPRTSFRSVDTLVAGKKQSTSRIAFMKFPDITPNAVPSDAFMITGVVMWIHFTKGSAGPLYFHRILRPWSDSITWRSGIEYVQKGYVRSKPSVVLWDIPSDWLSIQGIWEDVQAWLFGGEENHGWMISTPSKDSLSFDSSEVSDPYNQPQLFVTFACSTPPFLGGPVGANKYFPTADTTISGGRDSSTSFGSLDYVSVFSYDSESQALIKFDNLPRRVSSNTRISQAVLWVYATSASDGPVYVYRMLQSWSEYSTWNSFGGNGVQNNDIEAVRTPSVILNSLPGSGAWMSFHVEGDVASWVLGGNPNNGWVFISPHWDDFDFLSSAYWDPDLWPILYVTFNEW